jgi:hypothetical protein
VEVFAMSDQNANSTQKEQPKPNNKGNSVIGWLVLIGGIAITLHRLKTLQHDIEKASIVRQLDPRHVAAFGNGNNDRLMLRTVKTAGGLAVAVDNGEGCALDAILNANLFVGGSENALDLLLEPRRCIATLRTAPDKKPLPGTRQRGHS